MRASVMLLLVACAGERAPSPDARGLDRAPDLVVAGAATAVAGGDFDGDGRADLAILADGVVSVWVDAALADPAVPDHVVATPGATALVALPTRRGADLVTGGDAVTRWTLDGAAVWSGPAATALAAGDLDGDGVADLAAVTDEGIARFLAPDLTPGAVTPGTFAALSAGDTDGDGADELLAGDPTDPSRGVDAGAVHLVDDGAIVWTALGQGPGAALGTAVALIDGDGDGRAERIASAPGHHHDHLIAGRGAIFGWIDDGDPVWTARLNQAALDVRGLGQHLAAGDVTGDGQPDLLASDDAGRVFVWPRTVFGPSPWPAAWRGGGTAMVALPDLDGDGATDWAHVRDDAVDLFRGTPVWLDSDGDRTPNHADCAALDPTIHPFAADTCDLVDADCDGDLVELASDADGDGVPDCADLDHFGPYDGVAVGAGDLGAALALGDVDGDGAPDTLTLAPSRDWLVPGEGVLFTNGLGHRPTGAIGAGDAAYRDVAAGDVDGDGFVDAVVATDVDLRLYRGSPDGLQPWPSWTTTPGADAVALGDVDADGRADLVVVTADAGRYFRSEGLPGEPRPLPGGVDVVIGDVDGDGRADVVLPAGTTLVALGPDLGRTVELPGASAAAVAGGSVALGDDDVTLWSVDGEPVLTATFAGAALALASTDLNDDGYPDLFVGVDGAVHVHVGTPDGPAATPLVWPAPGIAVAYGSVLAAADGVLVVGAPDPALAGVFRWETTDDLDADGFHDALEWALGLSPADPDADGDGRLDGDERVDGALLDTDGDGVLDVFDTDSDDDGVPDGEDVCPLLPDDQADKDGDGLGDACDCPGPDPELVRALATVTDVAVEAGAADTSRGHHKRGRALVVADFDLDGRQDQFIGNPGDPSILLRNTSPDGGAPRFELFQEFEIDYAWTAAAGDYDNDGDYDLLVGGGGNECTGYDVLLRNDLVETGALGFTDVTEHAGVAGPMVPWADTPQPVPTTSVNWVDVDRDGDVDLFIGHNTYVMCGALERHLMKNTLYRNDGDGTFTDITDASGLGVVASATRHATWADFDGDGDDDLFESNMLEANVLWQNQLVETGEVRFVDVTDAVTSADVSRPWAAFASCAGDLDNDGLDDLVVFRRQDTDCTTPFEDPDDDTGHGVFLNLGDGDFANLSMSSGMSDHPVGRQARLGVMGCQLGDLNGDGFLDVFIGNGGPIGGQTNQLLLASSTWGEAPTYQDVSLLIDFPSPPDGTVARVPAYPYRTHGTAIVDADGDLVPELWVSNGGPSLFPDMVQEPNRLFRFDWADEARFLAVRPVGDGVGVPRDGIGTRLHLVAIGPDGAERSVWRTQTGGSCFAAQSGFEIPFGLGDAVRVDRLEVFWPDGTLDVIHDGLDAGARLVVER